MTKSANFVFGLLLFQLMQQKSELVSRCNELVELLNEQQREVKADVEGVFNNAEKQMGDERRLFNAGHEDRKLKVRIGIQFKFVVWCAF